MGWHFTRRAGPKPYTRSFRRGSALAVEKLYIYRHWRRTQYQIERSTLNILGEGCRRISFIHSPSLRLRRRERNRDARCNTRYAYLTSSPSHSTTFMGVSRPYHLHLIDVDGVPRFPVILHRTRGNGVLPHLRHNVAGAERQRQAFGYQYISPSCRNHEHAIVSPRPKPVA